MSRTTPQKIKLPKINLKHMAIIVGVLVLIAYIIAITKFTLFDFGLIIAFILIGAASRLPERFAPVALGIELVSLFTVVSAIKYGPIAGILVGAAAYILASFYTIERPQDVAIAVLGFVGMAYFAPIAYVFFGQNLGFMAIALTLGYDIITGIFYFFMGYGLVSVVRFTVVHTTANFFIISYLGAKLLGI